MSLLGKESSHNSANNPTQSQNPQPKWKSFHLKNVRSPSLEGGQIFMDHYLVVILVNKAHGTLPSLFDLNSQVPPEPTTLLAVDLRDQSIQEVELDKSLFHPRAGSIYKKYKDNQIINYSAGEHPLLRITIESFQPLSVKWEKIEAKGKKPDLIECAAEIYNDTLFLYGGGDGFWVKNRNRELWSFDLKGNFSEALSFISQDTMYMYPGLNKTKAFFVLNLKTLEWTQIPRTSHGLADPEKSASPVIGRVIYKDFLIALQQCKKKEMTVSCWNMNTDSWSNVDIKTCENHEPESSFTKDFAVYRNSLVVAIRDGVDYRQEGVVRICFLNLDQLDLSIPEAPDQENLRSLFMSEEKSDIKFKLQDELIPAHKQVLIEKSNYFANLFNSGMAESKQDIIEVPDDGLLFKEFLRFLYYGEVKKDEDLAIKLYHFADKYLQNDLREKCVDLLKSNITIDNVYKIYDLAHQENLALLKVWCLDFLEKQINVRNVSQVVEYLNKQNNAQEHHELRDKALKTILRGYKTVSPSLSPTVIEDFLMRNIALDTIVDLAKFVEGQTLDFLSKPKMEIEKETIGSQMLNLRPAILAFLEPNIRVLHEKNLAKEIPSLLLVELIIKKNNHVK